MTKSPSKKTIAVVIIAIVLAALATLSPVLLNSHSQKQSAPDNDIPADGSNPSANTGNNNQASDAGGANAPTAAPDNDIKAE